MGPISYVVIAGGSFALYPMIKKIIIKKEDSSDYSNSKIKTNAIDNGKFQAYDKSNLSNRTQSMIPKKFELKCDIGNIYDEKTVDPLTKSINDWTTTFGASLLTQTRYSITPTRYLNGVVQAGITDNTLGKYGRSILKASAPALGANSKSNFYRVNVNSRGFPSKTDPHIKVPKPVVTYAGPVLTGLKVISDGLFALAIVSTSAVLLDAYLDEEKSFRETLAFETAKWTGSSVGGYAGATIGAAFGTAVLGTAGGVIGAVSAGMYGSYVGMREVTEFVQNEERRNRVLSLLERFLFCIFNAIKWIIDQYLHFFCMLMEKIEELTKMRSFSYMILAGERFEIYPALKRIITNLNKYQNSNIITKAIDKSILSKKTELKCDLPKTFLKTVKDKLTGKLNDSTTMLGASTLTQTRYSITPKTYTNDVVKAAITDNTLGKWAVIKFSAPAKGADSKSTFHRINVNPRGFPNKTDPHIKVPENIVNLAGPVQTVLKVTSYGLFAAAILSTGAVLLDAYLDQEKSFTEALNYETAKWTGSSFGGYAGATIGAAVGTAALGPVGGVVGAVGAGMYGSYVGMREVTEFVQNEERRNRILSSINWIFSLPLMFVLAELKDTIRIAPEQFHLKLPEAIKDEINRKLANKVLLNVGLCIALKDIKQLGDSIILPGDGASHTVVHYRYIVFRPMIGEVLTGKIRSCNREGVNVSLGFFDDIFIPHTALQHPSRYEEAEQAWVWEYSLEDGDHHDLFMDINETIKFRVTGETFEESSPIGPPVTDDPSNSTNANLEPKVPYRITGSISEPGLGLISWWDQQNQDDEDGQGDEAVDPEEAEDGYEDNE
uniref:DNA-directed RNA polymerase III subunit RPC8 n=1 Tax=Culicoides sonorensis TaxID=179676 RepID=A0A336LV94_CULSO